MNTIHAIQWVPASPEYILPCIQEEWRQAARKSAFLFGFLISDFFRVSAFGFRVCGLAAEPATNNR